MTLVPPQGIQTGVYQGFLSFKGENHTVNAPVSFVSKTLVDQNDSVVIIEGKKSDDVMYGTGYTKGAFDMANRYMAGDWRQFYFDIQDDMINSAAVELSWESDDTNLSIFAVDPSGRIIQTNVPSGVFGHFLGWASLDWLGNSPFSQGGGFYPVKNKDDTSTVLYVPINQTGTYSILAHSTLFGGNSTTEPISLVGKFSNISKEMLAGSIPAPDQIAEPAVPSEDKEAVKTIEEAISHDNRPEPNHDEGGDSFGLGVVIGMASGIAVGSAAIILLRQRISRDHIIPER